MANTNDAAHPFDDIIDLVEKLADLESPAKDSLADVFNALGRGLRPLGDLEQSLVMLAQFYAEQNDYKCHFYHSSLCCWCIVSQQQV